LTLIGLFWLPATAPAYSHNQREVQHHANVCACVDVRVRVRVRVHVVWVGGWVFRRAAGPVATMCFLPIFLEVLCIIFACLIRQGPPRVDMDKV